jgi:hypothetical protein
MRCRLWLAGCISDPMAAGSTTAGSGGLGARCRERPKLNAPALPPSPLEPPPSRRTAERLEWWTLWLLCADADGVIPKEKIRANVRRARGRGSGWGARAAAVPGAALARARGALTGPAGLP